MLAVSVTDDPAVLDEVADDWRLLLTMSSFDDIFLGPEFCRAWWVVHGHDWNLRVVLVEDGNTLRLLAPLAVRKGTHDWQTVGARRADYSGPVYRSGDLEAVRAFVGAVPRFDGCDGIAFRGVPEGVDHIAWASATLEDDERVVQRALQFARISRPIVRSSWTTEHPYIDRSGIVAQSDRLDRKDVRYMVRWLERTGEIAYERHDDPSRCMKLLPEFFELHVRSFEERGMVSQFTHRIERDFFDALVRELGPRGELRFDILSLNDRLIAAHVGFERASRAAWYKPCFDPDLSKGSPGTVLLCHAIRDAYTRELNEFDLLRGTEKYKYRYATDARPTRALTIEPRRLRMVRRKMCRIPFISEFRW